MVCTRIICMITYWVRLGYTDIIHNLALHFTTPWCCNRHPDSGFQWSHFFKGRLLYQDKETSTLYYGDLDDPEREEAILPSKKRQKKESVKVRPVNERKPLVSRLLAWRASVHLNDPLASVRPPSFIIDNLGIKALARLHSSNITTSEEIVTVLAQTPEWHGLWSRDLFEVIRSYDQELIERRKDETNRKKARQKRAKYRQDQDKFEEESNETAERIRQEVLSRYTAAGGRLSLG